MRAQRIVVGVIAGVLATAGSVLAVTASATGQSAEGKEFVEDGTCTVPDGVTCVSIQAWGGDGGEGEDADGGAAGRVAAFFPVTTGDALAVTIGSDGGDMSGGTGFNKGGDAELSGGGGGGGSTGVTKNGPDTVLIVAGGGGGGGADDEGGNGGAGFGGGAGNGSAGSSGADAGAGGIEGGFPAAGGDSGGTNGAGGAGAAPGVGAHKDGNGGGGGANLVGASGLSPSDPGEDSEFATITPVDPGNCPAPTTTTTTPVTTTTTAPAAAAAAAVAPKFTG